MNSVKTRAKKFRKSIPSPFVSRLNKSSSDDPAFGDFSQVLCCDQVLPTLTRNTRLSSAQNSVFKFLFRKCIPHSIQVSFRDLQVFVDGVRKRCWADFYIEFKSVTTGKIKGLVIQVDGAKHFKKSRKDNEVEHYFKEHGIYLLRFSSDFILNESKIWHHIIKRFIKEAKVRPPFAWYTDLLSYSERIKTDVMEYRKTKIMYVEYTS